MLISSFFVVSKIQQGGNLDRAHYHNVHYDHVHDDHVDDDHVHDDHVNNVPDYHVNDYQVEASCPGSQFVHGGQQFALETRSISGDVDLPQFQFKTANFQPQGDHTGGVDVADHTGGVDVTTDEKRKNGRSQTFSENSWQSLHFLATVFPFWKSEHLHHAKNGLFSENNIYSAA